MCAICTNCDEWNMITYYSQGVTICLGEDGKGRGGVVENIPVHTTQCNNSFVDPYRQFFSQAEFTSEWLTYHHQCGKRMRRFAKTFVSIWLL